MSEHDRISKLRIVIFDIDGVFTDGRVWQDASGVAARKFSVRDAMGLRALKKAGIQIAVVTPAQAPEIRAHMASLGIVEFTEGCPNKSEVIDQILKSHGVDRTEAAFVSGSQHDLALMKDFGFSCTVPSASELLLKAANHVTKNSGGDGAVLEICNLILQHRNPERVGRTGWRQEAV